ncbi:MAG: hypothetical protein NT142_01460 [Planctomycetota bacterium]|nr:hypothetical protein [Planctomycetota bacterium]
MFKLLAKSLNKAHQWNCSKAARPPSRLNGHIPQMTTYRSTVARHKPTNWGLHGA